MLASRRSGRRSRRPLPVTVSAVAALAALLTGTGCTSSSSSPDASADGSSSPAGDGGERREAAAGPVWDASPSSMAALGDSITQAFDACSVLSDCPEASWATGTEDGVNSLALRLLRDERRVADRAWNLSESGATVADLPEQARRAVAHRPQLVTILIGANDACAADVGSMTGVAEFEEDFTEALGLIREELPRAQVYVSSVPDLMRLWEEGSGSSMAGMVWEVADICPSMLGEPRDDSGGAARRREEVRDRVRAYNAVMAEACAADPLCRYDGGAVFRYPFTADHLSRWDWFHPSREGQAELARLAYEGVTRQAGQPDR